MTPRWGYRRDGTCTSSPRRSRKETRGYGLFGVDPVTGDITENVAIWGHPSQRLAHHLQPGQAAAAARPAADERVGLRGVRVALRQQPYAGYVCGVNVTIKKADAVDRRVGGQLERGGHLAGRRRHDVRRARPDLLHLGQRGLPQRPRGEPPGRAASRVGDPAGGQRHRGADRPGLLQPGQRALAGRRGHRLRRRRAGRLSRSVPWRH